jgi:hypothetical protein
VADPNDRDDQLRVFDLIDHPVVIDPHPPQTIAAREQLAPWRSWRSRELLDPLKDPTAMGWGDAVDLLSAAGRKWTW